MQFLGLHILKIKLNHLTFLFLWKLRFQLFHAIFSSDICSSFTASNRHISLPEHILPRAHHARAAFPGGTHIPGHKHIPTWHSASGDLLEIGTRVGWSNGPRHSHPALPRWDNATVQGQTGTWELWPNRRWKGKSSAFWGNFVNFFWFFKWIKSEISEKFTMIRDDHDWNNLFELKNSGIIVFYLFFWIYYVLSNSFFNFNFFSSLFSIN